MALSAYGNCSQYNRVLASEVLVGDRAAEDLEQGALAGAVATDDAEDLAALDLEGDVAQGPDKIGILGIRNIFYHRGHRERERKWGREFSVIFASVR